MRRILWVGLATVAATLSCGVQSEPLPTPYVIPSLTPNVRVELTPGRVYWLSSVPDPLVGTVYFVGLQNIPSDVLSDPTVAIVGFLGSGTPVILVASQDRWCYVSGEGTDEWAFVGEIEGWVQCEYLLQSEPTPFPTPDLTPVQP